MKLALETKLVRAGAVLVLMAFSCQQSLPNPPHIDEDRVSIEQDDETLSFPMEVQRVLASHHLLREPRSLCALLSDASLVGEFEVERIVVDQGRDPVGERSGDIPVTAVTLVPQTIWKGTGGNVQIRMRGGIRPDGAESSTDAAFAAGETVVVFLEKKWSDGTWAAMSENIFHDEGTGYTNGTVLGLQRHTAADIGARLAASPCDDVASDADLADASRTAGSEEAPHEAPDGVLVED